MQSLVRVAVAIVAAAVVAVPASAATPKEVEDAIKRGTNALRAHYKEAAKPAAGPDQTSMIGVSCMAGLAMLEGGVPPADPALKIIANKVRDASYGQTQTYGAALCLLFLDRLGEPEDEPLIQILAVRLLAGQRSTGGWSYATIDASQVGDINWLKGIKPPKGGPAKLLPEVEQYAQFVASKAGAIVQRPGNGDDNSNTQFAVIAVWLARKHGVPVDGALDLIEKRFLSSQNPRTGGWPYAGDSNTPGSPSMYCAGLIGLATGIARREERRAKAEAKKEASKEEPGAPKKEVDDPLFNAPTKTTPEPKKPKYAPDERDRAVAAAFDGLGAVLQASVQAGGGGLLLQEGGTHGLNDLYFFWSLERACVIYGMDKVRGVNWWEAGAHTLVVSQQADGNWHSHYESDVATSFAVLFLCKSNLARDLSSKVQKETITEMRNAPGAANAEAKNKDSSVGGNIPTEPLAPTLPGAVGNESATLAAELVRSYDKDWDKVLKKLKDSRGGSYTLALVNAANRLEGDRLKQARDALAERLTRMTADTLRTFAKSEEPELRRGALLAMAMKDDKSHIPDLINAVDDEDEFVVRAVSAGLRSLTGQDFGPRKNSNEGEKKIAKDEWSKWWNKQEKKK
jgi:hypothetical protein